MGRAIMIPGYLGSNIEGVLYPKRKTKVSGNWSSLPKTVSNIGSKPEDLFASYFDVQKKVGAKEMKKIPLGAIAFWTLADKLACGMQQLMAGARKFSLDQITREDLFSGNRETAAETGIPHASDVNDESAKKILNS